MSGSHEHNGKRVWAPEVSLLSRTDIEKLQTLRLREYLGRLKANRYFADRLGNLDPSKFKKLSDIQLLPMESKADLLADLAAHPPYGSRLGVSPGRVREVQTSGGTSGKGVEAFCLDESDLREAMRVYAECWIWSGFHEGMSVALPIPVGIGAAGLLAPRATETIGGLPLRLGLESTQRRVDLMHHFRTTGLFTGTVYLDTLRFESEQHPLGRPPLTSILFAGAPYSIDWVERHRDFWHCELHEMYASSQMGSAIAATCEQGVPEGTRGCMHCFEWAVLVEVLNPDTQSPVGYGEEGEIVITPFYRRASPLLRYRTGDRARLLSPHECSCGRGFRCLETGTISRYDDMFKIKLVNVWASDVDRVLLDMLGAREYEATLGVDHRGREYAKVLVYGDGLEHEQIVTALREEIGVTFDVEVAAADGAPIYQVKPKRWKDLRQQVVAPDQPKFPRS